METPPNRPSWLWEMGTVSGQTRTQIKKALAFFSRPVQNSKRRKPVPGTSLNTGTHAEWREAEGQPVGA